VIAPVDPLSRRIVHRSIWKLHLIAIANDLIKSAQSRFAQLKHLGAALNIPHPVARQFDGLGFIHFNSLNYSDRLTAAKIHRDFEPSSFDGVAIWPGETDALVSVGSFMVNLLVAEFCNLGNTDGAMMVSTMFRYQSLKRASEE
jgi:hypothetical protein